MLHVSVILEVVTQCMFIYLKYDVCYHITELCFVLNQMLAIF